MVWGRQDPHVPREGRRIIYDAISDANLNFAVTSSTLPTPSCATKAIVTIPPHGAPVLRHGIELFKRRLGEGDLPATRPDASAAQTKH